MNEVSAVDKYEYKLKTEQMLELMESGAYNKAAEVAVPSTGRESERHYADKCQ